jgi:hypothetical protein
MWGHSENIEKCLLWKSSNVITRTILSKHSNKIFFLLFQIFIACIPRKQDHGWERNKFLALRKFFFLTFWPEQVAALPWPLNCSI